MKEDGERERERERGHRSNIGMGSERRGGLRERGERGGRVGLKEDEGNAMFGSKA